MDKAKEIYLSQISKGAKKNFKPDIELDVPEFVMISEGRTKKGKGMLSMAFKLKESWVDKDGRLIFVIDGDSEVDSREYDKYGNQLPKLKIRNKF